MSNKAILRAMSDDDLDMVSGGTVVPYIVQAGDSVKTIADKFHITVEQLEKWNNIDPKTGIIGVGDPLKIKY